MAELQCLDCHSRAVMLWCSGPPWPRNAGSFVRTCEWHLRSHSRGSSQHTELQSSPAEPRSSAAVPLSDESEGAVRRKRYRRESGDEIRQAYVTKCVRRGGGVELGADRKSSSFSSKHSPPADVLFELIAHLNFDEEAYLCCAFALSCCKLMLQFWIGKCKRVG